MAHVDDPKKKKTISEKRDMMVAACRETPCAGFMKKNPPCVICVHEGLIRRNDEL